LLKSYRLFHVSNHPTKNRIAQNYLCVKVVIAAAFTGA
jgi:hypothetical protein